MSTYAKHVSTRVTPQSEPVHGKGQVANSAGGYVFAVDCWTRLNRFLILGSEGGSYYASERTLTKENAESIWECFRLDPDRTIQTIVDVSVKGLAPKNDPAVFALAMLSKDKRALEAMPKVCRIGTHLFDFVDAAKHFRGRGRAFLQAIRQWYLSKTPEQLSYQLVKYQQRNGWSHRDLLRLCKPRGDETQSRAFRWATGKTDVSVYEGLELIAAFEQAKRASSKHEIVKLIEQHGLVRECIPTQFLNEPEVWEALLQKMPMTAMIRNLGKMSAVGLLKPMSEAVGTVSDRLADVDRLHKARIHPMAILLALGIYRTGRGLKGSLSWVPDANVIDALGSAFYLCFDNAEPTGKRHLLALDVSGSMTDPLSGSYLSCREASAAMAMIAVKNERLTHTAAFTSSRGNTRRNAMLQSLDFSKHKRLDDAVEAVSGLPFGGTDCALPMLYALEHGIDADVFVVYTDSETWAGNIHPFQALQQYRDKTGIPAKLIVCGMVSNGFSIADPNDAGMLDVVGFSADVPKVMSDFVKG